MHASPQWVILLAVLMAQQPAAAALMQADLLWQDASDVASEAVADAPVVEEAAPVPAGEEVPVEPVNPILSFFQSPINLILISAILFLFIVVRPQQQQLKDQQKLLAGLKKNDRVVTASGIHGTITQAADGEAVVVIRIDDNSGAKMTINRDSIAKVVTAESKE